MTKERKMTLRMARRQANLMLGIRRWPEDKRPTRFVSELLHGDQYKFIGPARGLDRAVELATARGFWDPVLQERTERFVTSFGMLYGENFLQAAIKIKQKDSSDEVQDKLYDNALQAYRRLKKRAGQFFLLSYPKMIELGQDPDQYLARVEIAKDAGGSLFAAKFARYLPNVIVAGGNQDEYGSAALAIRHEASFKMSSLFMSLAPEMATEGEGSMYDYAARVEDSINTVGPELTSWAMPAYVYLQHRAGRDSQQTQDDLLSMRDEHGERAAKWYAAGLRRIGEDFISSHPTNPSKHYRMHRNEFMRLGTKPSTLDTLVKFRDSYLDVLNGLGITAASFYARTVEFDDPISYKDALLYTQQILGKTFFDKALWAIIRSNNGVWNETDVFSAWLSFNHLVAKYRKYATEHFPALMDYAIKTASKKSNTARGNFGLEQPGSTSNRYFERYPEMYAAYHDHHRPPDEHSHEGETALYIKTCRGY